MKTATILAAALSIASVAAAPARAAEVIIKLTGNATATSGTDGNPLEFKGTGNGQTVNVRATGWSIEGGFLRDSYLAAYSNGLGVTSGDDGNGGNNLHATDNQTRIDFVVLQFDRAVQLKSADLNVYRIAGELDSDASWGVGTTSTSWKSSVLTNNASVNTLYSLLPNRGIELGSSTSGSRSIGTGQLAGNVWIIGAAYMNADGLFDGFKLASIKVNTVGPAPAPEPETWATMILGFGAVGGTLRMRRRRRVEATAGDHAAGVASTLG